MGMIFPVPVNLVDRLFDGRHNVFVKYAGSHNHARATKLKARDKVVFYASHGTKHLVGEGTIERIELMRPERVLAKYRDRLFLKESELYAYVRSRPSRPLEKEMLTIVMTKIRRYKNPFRFSEHITMTGKYLSSEEYRSLPL